MNHDSYSEADISALRRDAERLQFLEDETNKGCAPNLVFDDGGNWAVSYEGTQPMPLGDGEGFKEPVGITCWVEPEQWKPSIREAIDDAIARAAIDTARATPELNPEP